MWNMKNLVCRLYWTNEDQIRRVGNKRGSKLRKDEEEDEEEAEKMVGRREMERGTPVGLRNR